MHFLKSKLGQLSITNSLKITQSTKGKIDIEIKNREFCKSIKRHLFNYYLQVRNDYYLRLINLIYVFPAIKVLNSKGLLLS